MHFPTYPPSPAVRNPRLVWTLHDTTWWRFPQVASWLGRTYYKPLARWALQHAYLVVPSMSVCEEVYRVLNVPAERISVAHPGLTPLAQTMPEKRSRPYLLAVGTLEPRKNLQRLVSAFLSIPEHRDVELVLVGRIGWGTVPTGVTVLTDVDDVRLSGLYRGASGLALPSLYEGFGLPLIEAMSVGTPVLCSDLAVFHEVAGDLATYFNPLRTGEIGEAIRQVLRGSPPPASRMIERASSFTWQACAAAVRRVYRGLA